MKVKLPAEQFPSQPELHLFSDLFIAVRS